MEDTGNRHTGQTPGGPRARGALLALAVLAASGCGEGIWTHPPVALDGGSGGVDGGGSWRDRRIPCSAALACPGGQLCLGGECTVACESDEACTPDEYCARSPVASVCRVAALSFCPQVPCAATQACLGGLCTGPASGGTCEPGVSGSDGCGIFAGCLLDESARALHCRDLPGCPLDGLCPAGERGSICNDGFLPEKARVCLVGLCRTPADCPPDWRCMLTGRGLLGFCSAPPP